MRHIHQEEAWQLLNCAIKKQTIIIVAAKAKNDTIGKDNALPWKLPEDMKRFKSISVDEATFDEIERLSKILLPGVKLFKSQVVESLIEVALKSIIKLSKEKNETQ